MDLLNGIESTGCDMKVVWCKIAAPKNDMNCSVEGLRYETSDLYISIRYNVNHSLVEVMKNMKEIFDREEMSLRQGV